MSTNEVRRVGEADAAAAIAAMVVGFATDPVARWCWPDPNDYLQNMPQFISKYGGKAFQSDSAYVVGQSSGAALWLPPDVHPDDEALGELMSESVAVEKQGDLFASFEELGGYHPEGPHWFLPLVAVDAAHQGRGLGSALMQAAVDRCDADGMVAYLESSNPLNITLYERHGFNVVGAVQVGDAPPFTPMIREAR